MNPRCFVLLPLLVAAPVLADDRPEVTVAVPLSQQVSDSEIFTGRIEAR